jgi:hypothetical protein
MKVLIHIRIPGQIWVLFSGSFLSNIDIKISDNECYVAGLDLCNFNNNVAKFLEQITELEY